MKRLSILILALSLVACHKNVSEAEAYQAALNAVNSHKCTVDAETKREQQGDSWQYGWRCKPDAEGEIQIIWVNVTMTGKVSTDVEHERPNDPPSSTTVLEIPAAR